MEGPAFRFRKDPDGIGLVTIDTPGEKINKLSRSLFGEIPALIESCRKDPELKGVVLISGKKDSFIAGADIDDFLEFKDQKDAETMSRRGQEMLALMEALPVPLVAAIHGACLGGGLETALACHYRICSDSDRTVLGLPEVRLGLIPGGGGTQRLPRLIGSAKALDLILTGKNVRPRAALRMGLIDEVVPRLALETAARRAVLDLAAGRRRPRRPGFRRLSDLFRGRMWISLLADRNPLGRILVGQAARKRILKTTKGLYPAPLKALDCVRTGLSRGAARGFALESRAFGELAMTAACRELIGLFFAVNAIKKDSGAQPAGSQPRPVKSLGVIGAGFMGSGIAAVSAGAGIRARMRDQSFEALGKGLRFCHDFFHEKLRKGRLSRLEFEQMLDKLSGTLDYSGFGCADLVIEAVFEDLDLKHRVVREAESRMRGDAVFASNTSSIPIARIMEASRRPGNVLGLHFFSPVARMPLLEIIITPRTSAEAVATAVAYAKDIGKTPIVVKDGPGFYTSRILAPYMNEATRLLEEGATVEAVDAAMQRFGYPVGPLALLDEVGLDVAQKVAGILVEAFGPRMSLPESSSRFLETGRLGRKSGSGFYQYRAGRKQVDNSIYDIMARAPRRAAAPAIMEREIQRRLALAMANEAVLCLQEGILRSPRDGDVGAVLGLGFPPFRGGPFRYIDREGAPIVLTEILRLAEKHAPRFAPAALLDDMARQGKKFYS